MSRIPVISRQFSCPAKFSGNVEPSQNWSSTSPLDDSVECLATPVQEELGYGQGGFEGSVSVVENGTGLGDSIGAEDSDSGLESPQGDHHRSVLDLPVSNPIDCVGTEDVANCRSSNVICSPLSRGSQNPKPAPACEALPKRSIPTPSKVSGIPTLGSFSPNKFVETLKKKNGFNAGAKGDCLDGCGTSNQASNGVGARVGPPTRRAPSSARYKPSVTPSHSSANSMLNRNHKPHYCTHDKEKLGKHLLTLSRLILVRHVVHVINYICEHAKEIIFCSIQL